MPPATEPAERSWTSRYPSRSPYPATGYQRQPFHNPRTSYGGAAGHFIHLGMVTAPLVIGEVFKDPEQRWRALRFVPIAGAIAGEIAWTLHVKNERQKAEEAKAELRACHEHGR